MDLKEVLREVVRMGASDLHLVSNSPPIVRLHGQIEPLDLPRLSPKELHELIMGALSDEQTKERQGLARQGHSA